MSGVLSRKTIRLGLTVTDRTDIIMQCSSLLVAVGAVVQPYADAMFECECQMPTYLGERVAIPHGANESWEYIQCTRLGFLQLPGGVDWDGERVFVCIPIASRGEEHVEIFGELAEVLMDLNVAAQLYTTTDPDNVLRLLGTFGKED